MLYQGIYDQRWRIWHNGYRPARVWDALKHPNQSAWTTLARTDPPHVCTQPPIAEALGTCILGAGLVIPDVDVDDKAMADYIVAWITERFGWSPRRFRQNSTRTLLLYAAPDGEMPHKAVARHLASKNAVEVLGHGNQANVYGTHPSGAILEWVDGRGPDSVRRSNLNVIDEPGRLELVDFCAGVLGADSVHYGCHLNLPPTPRTTSPHVAPTFGSGIGTWPIGDVSSALLAIPNPPDYDTWFKLAAATYAATGGSPAGYQAFLSWCRRWPGHHDADAAKMWRGLTATPPSYITAGTLHHYAAQHDPLWQQPSRSFTRFDDFFPNQGDS